MLRLDRPSAYDGVEGESKNHVRALPERKQFEIRFPVVENYVFALNRNVIRADVSKMARLDLDPTEPTALFVQPTVGYRIGAAGGQGPGDYALQTRDQYYQSTHIQEIVFEIARQVVNVLVGNATTESGQVGNRAFLTRSRQQLFPQVLRLAQDYVDRKITVRGADKREIGHQIYTKLIVERLVAAIEPDETQGEPPLLPILNRYKPIGTTADFDFKTTKPCHLTPSSHLNQATADTFTWEQSAAFRLEQAVAEGIVAFYARNEGLGLLIPYDYAGVPHVYEPDYLVRLTDRRTLILEIKGYETDQEHAKHTAARRWVAAVNNWRQEGIWGFHLCKDPQQLLAQLRFTAEHPTVPTVAPPLSAAD